MSFEYYRPRRLPGLVELIWEQHSSVAQRWRILPSGRVELIFRLGAAFTLQKARILGPESPPLREFCFLSGLHTRPLDLSFDTFHVFGVRLHPVAVWALFRIPCSEVRDGAVEGDVALGGVDRIEDALHAAPGFHARARWMENELADRLRRGTAWEEAERMRSLVAAMPVTVSPAERELRQLVGYSRSHTHRLFSQWLGQSAADALRIGRFVQAVTVLHQQPGPLTEIGYQLGYFDQAHFIRCFREYSEMTPGEYRDRMGQSPGQLPL